jgi:pimeloyl-ACP methyl ester carboxylesterase
MSMSISIQLGERREVELPQGTIRYRERGRGEPLVFVHGFMVNGDLWRKVVPGLATDFRCIVPDLPFGAHEIAMKPDADLTPLGLVRLVRDFIAALGLENVTLVGNDTGGAICQLVVTEYPERIDRLVLTSCDAFELFPPPIIAYIFWVRRIPGALYLLMQSMRVRALRRLPIAYGWVAKRPIEERILDGYVEAARRDAAVRRDVDKVLAGIAPRYTLEAAEKLRAFTRPTLIVWAREDRVFPYEVGRRLAGRFPNARLEAVDDSYTFVPEDQPERLVTLVRGFMREPRQGRVAAS